MLAGGAQMVEAQAIAAAPATLPATTESELQAMTRLAGVIFAGRVTALRRLSGSDGATGVVEIEFAVDDAVRGVGGGSYTLREWAGLWAGNEPFRVGQRYLMLLHAPGRGGLSSPVGGTDGAIPILTGGMQVDLRWIGTRVVRPIADRVQPVGRPTFSAVEASGDANSSSAVEVNLATPTASAAPASSNADYANVLGLLRSWEKAGDAR
jgi:hypothetical protein